MTTQTPDTTLDDSVDAVVKQARAWLAATEGEQDEAAQMLGQLMQDPAGVDFTMDFVDRVARPEDNQTAAQALSKIPEAPEFLSGIDRLLLNAGTKLAGAIPQVVMPAARKRMRQLVGHLVLDSEGSTLNSLLEEAAEKGEELNLNLLGEAVLGDDEAADRARRTLELIENPRVTYVSVKATSLCAQLNPWDVDGNVERLKEQLRPLYRAAIKQSPRVFINLDMEEYKDLRMTIRLFTELLGEEEFHDYETGIVLQAYLPDSFAALQELAEFGRARVAAGGAPIKIRLVKGANLSMEKAEAEVHGWKQAPYDTKAEVDANYLRLLDHVLVPENLGAVRLGVASHNLYSLAAAKEIAERRGVMELVDAEMLQGMAPAQARAVKDSFPNLILYTPVVAATDFDVAVSYLVRRLEENSADENFLHALFTVGDAGERAMDDQEERFRSAVADRREVSTKPQRRQNREIDSGLGSGTRPGRFRNEPDTDPALVANRRWGVEALSTDPGPASAPEVSDPEKVDASVDKARELAVAWGATASEDRADVLDVIAESLANRRQELISAMAWEADKAIAQADVEVSEAVDFATYYAESARALGTGYSTFVPEGLVVVTPPWNFPVAIPVGGVLASLAAGSAVIIKPAPQVVRCAEVAVDAIRDGLAAAGEDPDLVQLVRADEGEAGKRLMSHPRVDHVILTGASETARLFRSWDPQMSISAETSGKNALIITASCDPDLAIDDLVDSAFGHAGQKCSASSLVIFVGPAGKSKRLRTQLYDAVRTLKIGRGIDVSTRMNGLIEPPGEKLKKGLTTLEPGEEWLIEPKQLDEEGTLWSPGVRDNVQPGSWYHQTECFGPVLGIMYADTLEEAVEWQNQTGFGLTGGIHTLDTDEIAYWREHVEVGNAYVNRGITGAIVQRQSFGGWKNSAIGPGAKAGGPNYVGTFGTWVDNDALASPEVSVQPKINRMLESWAGELDEEDRAWLWRAAELDQHAWDTEFGREHDRTGLRYETNIFRYLPLLEPLLVRIGEGAARRDVYRLLLAAARTGSPVRFTARPGVAEEFSFAENMPDEDFARLVTERDNARVRTVGAVDDALYEAAVESDSVVMDSPVLADGRRELLPWLLEQTVSTTTHRFGIIREPMTRF